jgi:hypothetical protein
MDTTFWLGSLDGGDYLEDLDIDDSVVLEWILRKYGGNVWTRCIWLRKRTSEWLL